MQVTLTQIFIAPLLLFSVHWLTFKAPTTTDAEGEVCDHLPHFQEKQGLRFHMNHNSQEISSLVKI